MSIMPLSKIGVRPHDGVVTKSRFSQVSPEQMQIRSSEAPRSGPVILVVIDPASPARLRARCNRRWTRVMARVLASSLDRRLARGCAPESHRLLAARAQVLVAPVMRDVLSGNWANLLTRARTDPTTRDPRGPLNRAGLLACEPDVAEMLEMIRAPFPIAAAGVAMASDLLSDGTGPVYDRRRSADLALAIRAVMARLDPSAPLLS
jgi:hypothetical protein